MIALLLLLMPPIAAARAASTAAEFNLPCMYDSRRESMTALKRCASREGKHLRLRPDVLSHAVFDGHGLTDFYCDGNWWYARRDGRTQRMDTMDNGPDAFHSGLARAIAKGKTGFVNRRLQFVIPPTYDHAMPFEHGRAAVCNGCVGKPEGEHSVLVGGVWGAVNRSGREIEALHAVP